ncbi:TetR/AcrR family transcriptional regulator [Leuconostocaceae bacterium ESL0958]|nr:TetR/AcrR family transcriptional regulator [Leuconostocaceae bacterium ESL0958]
MKTDARFVKTEKAIRTAFLDLLKKDTYQHISVQEIIHRAGINRSTFYAHFLDKEDLMEAVQNDLLDGMVAQIPPISWNNVTDANLVDTRVQALVDHFYRNRDLVALLLSEQAGHSFESNLSARARTIFYNATTDQKLSIPKNYALMVLTGTVINLIITWVRSGFQESPEEFATIIEKVIPPVLEKVIRVQPS